MRQSSFNPAAHRALPRRRHRHHHQFILMQLFFLLIKKKRQKIRANKTYTHTRTDCQNGDDDGRQWHGAMQYGAANGGSGRWQWPIDYNTIYNECGSRKKTFSFCCGRTNRVYGERLHFFFVSFVCCTCTCTCTCTSKQHTHTQTNAFIY